MVNDMIDYTIN